MRYTLVRGSFIAKITVILVAALGFLALLLGIAMTGNEMPLGGAVAAALFLSFAVHLLLRAQWAKFDKGNWDRPAETVQVVGGVVAALQILFSLVVSALMIAGFLFLFRLFVLQDGKQFQLTQTFYAILIAIAAYALIVRPFIGRAGKTVMKVHSAYMPKYEVAADALMIDFNMTAIGARAKAMNQKVRISFDELTEVKAMGFHEARHYLGFQVGPSVTRAWRNITDMPMFLAGKLPRPRVQIRLQTGGQTLILRGPELLYALTMGKEDCSDAVQAFEAYKSKNPRP